MTIKKTRLDLALELGGFFASRTLARTAIMDGAVLVDGVKITKPGTLIKDGSKIELTRAWKQEPYVSRGGLKLEKAIKEFGIDVENRVCLDLGASTGGFTDCLLKHGARLVYAIDVGYGQIAWSLRQNARVLVLERTNARYLEPSILKERRSPYEQPDLAVMDLSFISIMKVLPAAAKCLEYRKGSEIIALIKPQFEAGPEKVAKGGVVRSKEVHFQVLSEICRETEKSGLYAKNLTYSPLKGPKGNIEFLIQLSFSEPSLLNASTIEACIKASEVL